MSVNEVRIKRAASAFEVRGSGPITSRTFVLGDEDHTLGNALRHVLMNDARVDFAGYCVPHPSEPVVHIRVQTNGKTARGGGRWGRGGIDGDRSAEGGVFDAIETVRYCVGKAHGGSAGGEGGYGTDGKVCRVGSDE